MALTRTALPGPWRLDLVEAAADADAQVASRLPVPATVPGSVHTDLLAAGLIADPYLDRNELDTPWIGHSSWAYETELTVPQDGQVRHDLAFDGLDTLATIELDGVEVARTANMFRRYRVPLTAEPGTSVNLRVTFASAWDPLETSPEAERTAYEAPRSFIRKMASNFGWDWGPVLVTAGIWRPVRIEGWTAARLASVRCDVTADLGDAPVGRVRIAVGLEREGDERALSLRARVHGTEVTVEVAAADAAADVALDVPLEAADLWWPRGYGAQPLHELTLELVDAETGEVLEEDRRQIGFRHAELDTTPDAEGTPFVIRVNGVAIPSRGFNWIPDDCFPHRVTRADVDERLRHAVEAHANIIRVWGGGLYESDELYAACDELGLLTWQDFAFACAPYPETPELVAEVDAEARDNVERLMSHPSLVVWNGNNENWLGHDDWGWVERLDGRPWGEGYYLDLLPRVVAEVAPSASYWPGSPYSGSPERHSNEPAHGTVHLWEPWLLDGYATYRDYRARYVSEFGWQGPPAWRTLTDAVHDDPLTPTSPGMAHHQKADDGHLKLTRGLAAAFDEPDDMTDWHWAMQLNQARAIQLGVEHFRSLRPLNTGVILWQLNDCWPVTSWAVVDSANRRRPAWYGIKAAFEPRLATVQPRDGGQALVLVSDEPADWSGTVQVRRVGLDGTELARWASEFTVPAGGAVTFPLPDHVVAEGDAGAQLLVVDTDGAPRACWYGAADRDLAYPAADLDVSLAPGERDGDTVVTVAAGAFVRDLTVHPDRLGADVTVDTALVTLLPGESATFVLTGELDGGSEGALAALRGPALRHAGDLVVR